MYLREYAVRSRGRGIERDCAPRRDFGFRQLAGLEQRFGERIRGATVSGLGAQYLTQIADRLLVATQREACGGEAFVSVEQAGCVAQGGEVLLASGRRFALQRKDVREVVACLRMSRLDSERPREAGAGFIKIQLLLQDDTEVDDGIDMAGRVLSGAFEPLAGRFEIIGMQT